MRSIVVIVLWVITATFAGEPCPAYLNTVKKEYDQNPKSAAVAWFKKAKLGLFVHYAFSSLQPGGKLEPRDGDLSPSELRNLFTATQFDADAIADLALSAGAQYITFTPYHGGGPFLFNSAVGHPNSVSDLPAKRDLVAELCCACDRRGLGLMLYVHANLAQTNADVYERNVAVFQELMKNRPLAGFWFDTESAYYKDKSRYEHLSDLYALIRSQQPQCLISFCSGVSGDEDFITFEHRLHSLAELKHVPAKIQELMKGKPVEICTTMQLDKKDGKGTKMWFNVEGAYHRTADDIWNILGEARHDCCNLLLNIGLRGDGSVHPADAAALRELGARIKKEGWPDSEHGMQSREKQDR